MSSLEERYEAVLWWANESADILFEVLENWSHHDWDSHHCKWCGVDNGSLNDCREDCLTRRIREHLGPALNEDGRRRLNA